MERTHKDPGNPLGREAPWIAALVAGFALWMVANAAIDAREAWDHPLYFAVVWPVDILLLGLGGWLAPWRAWTLAPAMALGHMLGMLATLEGSGALLPVGIVAMVVLHVPGHAAALFAAWFRRRKNVA